MAEFNDAKNAVLDALNAVGDTDAESHAAVSIASMETFFSGSIPQSQVTAQDWVKVSDAILKSSENNQYLNSFISDLRQALADGIDLNTVIDRYDPANRGK